VYHKVYRPLAWHSLLSREATTERVGLSRGKMGFFTLLSSVLKGDPPLTILTQLTELFSAEICPILRHDRTPAFLTEPDPTLTELLLF
jgi:hypothetical protein